jgi:hypothetical protein
MSIRRELGLRAEHSALDEKVAARTQAAKDLGDVPWYVRRLLGRWAKHRWAMDCVAAAILLLAVVGFVSVYLTAISKIKELLHR